MKSPIGNTSKTEDGIVLSEPEAAARLRVSPKTLATWRRQGTGPRFAVLGRLIRYRPSDLEAFVAASLAA